MYTGIADFQKHSRAKAAAIQILEPQVSKTADFSENVLGDEVMHEGVA